MKYAVLVDSGDCLVDVGERLEFGAFDTKEEAVEVAKSIVDGYLESAYEPDMSARLLFTNYRLNCWDPFIRTHDPSCKFLAADYAYYKSREMCGEPCPHDARD